jgi:DNA-binding transcriptional LysR family regulator
MTFQQLQYILDIRKTGSFSKTAKNFYVSQASISQAVNSLEQELGVEIFQRNWNGVVPTQQGALVLEEAGSICDHHRRLLESPPSAAHCRHTFRSPLP